MPTVTTNYFRQELAAGHVNLSGADTFAVALMSAYVSASSINTLKAQSAWSDVSANESSSVGYNAITLTAGNLYINDSINALCWSGTNISWNNISNEPYGLVIYRINDGLVVGFIDFGGPKEVVNGTLTIEWNTGGIAQII